MLAPRPPGPARMFALDMLRGLAVLLVLFTHLPGGQRSIAPVQMLNAIGWCGVDLFFVLSGFLISGLLYKELDRTGGLNLPRFWLRRGLKIWPSYFAAYGSIVALEAVAASSRGDLPALSRIGRRTLVNSIFVQNYFVPLQWPHSWTIAIEEHFYLLLPLLLLAMTAYSRGRPGTAMRGVPIVGAAVAILVLGLRLATPAQEALTGSLYYRTHYRVDALMFGVVLGYLGHHCPNVFARLARQGPLLLLLAASALLVPLAPVRLIHTWGFTLLYLGLGGLVVLAASRPDFGLEGPRPLRWSARALALLGVYSYTIYLGHSALEWLRREAIERLPAPPPPWLDQVAFLVLSVVAGVTLSHAVERPFLRLRERLVPSRRRAAPDPVPMPPGGSSLGTDPKDARVTA